VKEESLGRKTNGNSLPFRDSAKLKQMEVDGIAAVEGMKGQETGEADIHGGQKKEKSAHDVREDGRGRISQHRVIRDKNAGPRITQIKFEVWY